MNKTILEAARNAISWCKDEDEKDPDGRYWLSAYHGAITYLLIVKNGRILGSIPGGYHDSKRVNCTIEEWVEALNHAIIEKVKLGYELIKADGSGTYFYLRYEDDKKFISVKEYDVPSVYGGMHHNMEIH